MKRGPEAGEGSEELPCISQAFLPTRKAGWVSRAATGNPEAPLVSFREGSPELTVSDEAV